MGPVLREFTSFQNEQYFLLIGFNNQPVNVGYLLREIEYKGDKPVQTLNGHLVFHYTNV
jgi:hypothetical protein